jgi:hypothetical protein
LRIAARRDEAGGLRWALVHIRIVVHDRLRLSTSAQYVGPIKVCFPHVYGRGTLYHYNAATGQWEDITIRPVP